MASRVWVDCGISLLALFLALFTAEGIARLIEDTPPPLAIAPSYNVVPDELLGYALAPNATWRSQKLLENGTLVYDVTYLTDTQGRRITGDERTNAQIVIDLFGDSTAFGEGLPDRETLAATLARELPDAQMRTYAVSGWGPHNTLALMDHPSFEHDARAHRGLYVLIPAQLNRVAGNTLAPWAYDGPYYTFRDGTLVHDGSFRTGRAGTTRAYERFAAIREHSALLRVLNVQLPLAGRKEDIALTGAVLRALAAEYALRTNGTMRIVLHPEWNRTLDKKLQRALTRELENLTVIDASDIAYTDDLVIPHDQHPTGELNAMLARRIAAALADAAQT